METTKRIFGRIFTPDDLGKKSEAWLTISPRSILIESSIQSGRTDHWPILLGEFNGMDMVTFVNCSANGGIDVGAGGSYTKIRVSYCIKRGHFYRPSDLLFNKVVLLSSVLSDWIDENESIIEIENGTYKIPQHHVIVNVNIEGFRLTINHSHRTQRLFRELHSKRICTVVIESDKPEHINGFSEIWRALKKLILLLTNKNPEFDEFYLNNGEEFELMNVKDDLKVERFQQNIYVYYRLIKKSFETTIVNWFTQKKLKAVIDLALEKLFNTEMSSQGFFLNVCVALETLHDSFGNTDKEEIKNRLGKRDQIRDYIKDVELQTWFNRESSYWKNPTLKERLHSFRSTIEYIKGNSLKKYDFETFITNIVKTRNDMAHTGEYLKRFNYIELFLATKIIEFTLRIEILRIIGVEIDSDRKSILHDAKKNIEALVYLNKYE